jgi:hypothetical protein
VTLVLLVLLALKAQLENTALPVRMDTTAPPVQQVLKVLLDLKVFQVPLVIKVTMEKQV